MTFFQNVWWLLVLIGVMILIHELGHYWAARFFDVRVDAFSFGFGPRLFGFRKGETDFRFSIILIGGYVKMAGEQPGEEGADDPRSFLAKPRWQRLVIAFAGPAMNVILAVALLTGLFMFHYPKDPNADAPAVIGYVTPGSAAAKGDVQAGDVIAQIGNDVNPNWETVFLKEVSSANRELPLIIERDGRQRRVVIIPEKDEKNGIGVAGWKEREVIVIKGLLPGMNAGKQGLKPDDVIYSVNGQRILSVTALQTATADSKGQPMNVTVERDGTPVHLVVTPTLQKAPDGERYMLGVSLEQQVTITQLPLHRAFIESVRANANGASLIYQFLKGMIEQRISPKSLEGPIRIGQLSGDAARQGPVAFVGLMSMVSLNLAIFNLLPIPILDGGVILLLLVEMILRRDLSLQLKETVIKLGFVFLMVIVVFVLYNDITKILPG